MTKKQISIFVSVLCSIFFVYAIYMNLYGANAEVMINYYNINAAQQGFILTVQSIGGLIFSFVLALYGERFNKLVVLLIGLAVFATSTLFVGFTPSYFMLMVLVSFIGIGLVCVDIMVNGVISDVFPEKKNTYLAMTHAFYGLGTMFAPSFVILIVNPNISKTFAIPFLIVGIISIIVSIIYFFVTKKVMPFTTYVDKEKMKNHAKGHPAEIFKSKKAWALLGAGILYFSFQIGVGMWLPTYCKEIIKMDFEMAGVMLSVFFGGALLMRFLSPFFMKILHPKMLFFIFNIASAGVMFLALSVTNIPLIIALLFVSGFLQGSSVVCMVILAVEAFPTRTASASALAVFSLNIAVMSAPLWMGILATNTGFLLPMYLICCMLILSAYIVYKIKI